MKFRRNTKDEKTFKIASIFFLIAFIALLIVYLFTYEEELVHFIFVLLLLAPLYFYISYILKNDYVEFKSDRIILINHKSNDIIIEISDIELLLIPSSKALKNKFKANNIIIKRKDISNVVLLFVDSEVIV